jgi:hypothetical protein
MNTVQLEQVIMSSFSTSSTLRTTGSLLHEYPYTYRPFHQKQVSSTEKNPTYLVFMRIVTL